MEEYNINITKSTDSEYMVDVSFKDIPLNNYIGGTLDGEGCTITVPVYFETMAVGGIITGCEMLSDVATNTTIGVSINGVDAIGSGTQPVLNNETYSDNPIDWDTVTVSQGDIIRVTVLSNSNATILTVKLKITV